MPEEVKTEGEKYLESVWWSTINELEELTTMESSPQIRLEAADALLRYFTSLNTGIHSPFIPENRPPDEDSDDDDD